MTYAEDNMLFRKFCLGVDIFRVDTIQDHIKFIWERKKSSIGSSSETEDNNIVQE